MANGLKLVIVGLTLCGLVYLLTDKFKDVSQTDSTVIYESLMSHNKKCNQIKPISSDVRFVNSKLTSYRDDLRMKLEYLITRRADARDPELISLVRQFLDPPSRHQIKPVKQIVQTPQSNEALILLKHKTGGFFVEVGAHDGEHSSNTIYLEQRLGWTGLLIEMDPYYYTQLMGKSRRSWSINACISPYQYPVQMQFEESSGPTGRLVKGSDGPGKTTNKLPAQVVPCFTLETMLLALNQTRVDYFSLDVEGMELEVLQTIPFDKLDIPVLSVEYIHGEKSKKEYVKFMSEKGYRVHRDIRFSKPSIALYVADFIFVKNTHNHP